MLIEGYDLEILTPPCEPGAERYFAKAHLSVDISEVLPYLNGKLSGASYLPSANALTWREGGHKVAMHALEINVNNIESREWAQGAIDGLVELVNETWDRREELTPSYATVQRLSPMAVFQQLPQTNCALCGESTCFNFALQLAAAQRDLADCPPLFEPVHAENLAALQEAVEASGPNVG